MLSKVSGCWRHAEETLQYDQAVSHVTKNIGLEHLSFEFAALFMVWMRVDEVHGHYYFFSNANAFKLVSPHYYNSYRQWMSVKWILVKCNSNILHNRTRTCRVTWGQKILVGLKKSVMSGLLGVMHMILDSFYPSANISHVMKVILNPAVTLPPKATWSFSDHIYLTFSVIMCNFWTLISTYKFSLFADHHLSGVQVAMISRLVDLVIDVKARCRWTGAKLTSWTTLPDPSGHCI